LISIPIIIRRNISNAAESRPRLCTQLKWAISARARFQVCLNLRRALPAHAEIATRRTPRSCDKATHHPTPSPSSRELGAVARTFGRVAGVGGTHYCAVLSVIDSLGCRFACTMPMKGFVVFHFLAQGMVLNMLLPLACPAIEWAGSGLVISQKDEIRTTSGVPSDPSYLVGEVLPWGNPNSKLWS